MLARYYFAAKKFNYKNIVRITADCPLIDPNVVDLVIKNFFEKKVDYASNAFPPSYPDGLDVEVFSFKCLSKAYKNAVSDHDKEHVNPFMKRDMSTTKFNLKNKKNLSWLRVTLDEQKDFNLIKKILENFKNKPHFRLNDLIKYYNKNKKLFLINNDIKRNEGSDLNTGQKFWKRAKTVIPGGTMLFSKNPDLFLPENGLLIFQNLKDVSYGILTIMFMMTLHIWEMVQHSWIFPSSNERKINEILKKEQCQL